jgi:cytochrome c553
MRAIPFPSSNIIFDAQTHDPGAPKKSEGGTGGGASSTFANIYTGWPLVEHSALALAETANLIMIPGRLCQNGKPVPLDREDFRKAAQGLVDAGLAAHKAALAKNQEQLIEVSNQVAEACAACHEIYRDTPTDADRCTPKSAEEKK